MFSLNFACVLDSIPRTFTRRGVLFTHPVTGSQLVAETLTDAELLTQFDLYPVVETDKPDFNPRTQRITGPAFNFTGSVVEHVYTASYLPLDFIKEDFLSTARSLLSEYMAEVTFGYTVEEFRTWDQQRDEAKAYIADNLADVPMLDAIAASRGVTVVILANSVMVNSVAYSAAAGHILGRKLGLGDLIEAAPDGVELDRILADELYVNWTI